jgi:hypothetical protein
MACGAIDRNIALLMAAKAITHVQIHRAHGCALLLQITVAARARDPSANMRRMIEPDVGRKTVVVDSDPGKIFAAGLIGGHFPDFRPVFCNYQMTTHAEFHAGNSGVGSLIHSGVADFAL